MSLPNRPNSGNYRPFFPEEENEFPNPFPLPMKRRYSLPTLPPRIKTTREYTLQPLPIKKTWNRKIGKDPRYDSPLPREPQPFLENPKPLPFYMLPNTVQRSLSTSTRENFDDEGNIFNNYRTAGKSIRESILDPQSSNYQPLYETIQGLTLERPWAASQGGIPKYGLSLHPNLKNFLQYVEDNPNASKKDLQEEFEKCGTLNCAEDVFFGLTQENAKTQKGLSPRSNLKITTDDVFRDNTLNKDHYPNYLPLGKALGLNDSRNLIDETFQIGRSNPLVETERVPKDQIAFFPKNTTVFFQNPNFNPNNKQGKIFGFDHVARAERSGYINEPIFRHLIGEYSNRNSLDTLANIANNSGINKPRVLYSTLYSDVY